MPPKVLVSGAAVISNASNDLEGFRDALERGDAKFTLRDFHSPVGYVQLKCGEIQSLRDMASGRRTRFTQLGIAVVRAAMDQAGVGPGPDTGLILSTTCGTADSMSTYLFGLRNDGAQSMAPSSFPLTMFSTPAGLIAADCQISGPTTVCAGFSSICLAFDLLTGGIAKRLIAVSIEEISWLVAATYSRLEMIPGASEIAGLPFQSQSSGPVLGEVAAALVIETEQSALERGAEPLGEILGYGAIRPRTARIDPWNDPLIEAALLGSMRKALARIRRPIEDLRWVYAAANGTPNLDGAELRAIKELMARCPDRPTNVAPKSVTGETLGGGLAVNCLAALLNFPSSPKHSIEQGTPRQRSLSHATFALCNHVEAGGDSVSLAVGPWTNGLGQ